MGPYRFPSSFRDWISCQSPFRLVILEIIYTPIRVFEADLLHFFHHFDEFANNSAQVTDIRTLSAENSDLTTYKREFSRI